MGMFDHFLKIGIDHPRSIGEFLSAYIGIAHCPTEDTYIYNSSSTRFSTCMEPKWIGEASRMYMGHRKVLLLGYEEIMRRRTAYQNGHKPPIHEKMASPGTKSSFVSMTRYPVVSDEFVLQKTAVLALLAKNCNMILLGSVREAHVPRNPEAWSRVALSSSISDVIRPEGLPDYQWHRANVVLPLLQSPRQIWNLFHAPSACLQTVQRQLLEHFRTTGHRFLANSVINEILAMEWLPITGNALKSIYTIILRDHGRVYLTRYQSWLTKLAILWVAIINQAENGSVELVSGSRDDLYILQEHGLDWNCISDLAKNVAPIELHHMYSKTDCYSLFKTKSSKSFNRQALYKWNWDRLRCKFSPSLKHQQSVSFLAGGLPTSFASKQGRMSPLSDIRRRIESVTRCKVHEFLTRRNDAATNQTDNKNTIMLLGRSSLELDLPVPSVIQQLRQDIAFCPSVHVDKQAWTDSEVERTVKNQLRKSHQQLTMGLYRTTWD
jgi:hypothetical protein